jgi:SAM-dependent methyltransferase
LSTREKEELNMVGSAANFAMSSLDRKQASPRSATNPLAAQMLEMIRAYWISQIVGTFARLGIPDHLAGGPLAAGQLAQLIACHPGATQRLMRAAMELGLVVAAPGARFSLTALGETLQSDLPSSVRDSAIALTSPGHWLPWGKLSEAVRTGRCQTAETLGADLFEYYADNSSEGRSFTDAMSETSAQVADAIARVLDTSAAKLAIDIGGASGTLIAALLNGNPALMGTILERPHALPAAKAAIAECGLSFRCSVVEGDFFVAVPEADIFLLKSIIHDWDDDQSLRILSNCARALRPNGRVILIERLLTDDVAAGSVSLIDVNMLAVLPGRERTEREYADLFARAGLRLDRMISSVPPFSVIESRAR